jgi:hypothetical protein
VLPAIADDGQSRNRFRCAASFRVPARGSSAARSAEACGAAPMFRGREDLLSTGPSAMRRASPRCLFYYLYLYIYLYICIIPPHLYYSATFILFRHIYIIPPQNMPDPRVGRTILSLLHREPSTASRSSSGEKPEAASNH